MSTKMKNQKMTGFVLVLSAFMSAADSMTLQPILELLSTEVFPGYGYATVSMIMTASALALAAISILTIFLTNIGKKRLLIIGSILFTVGGLAGVLITNIYYIIFTRLIEGLGAGLVITVSMMLIPALFREQARIDKLMGLNGVVAAVFAALIGFTSGYIALVNWKLPFVFYACGIIVLLLQIAFIPNDQDMKPSTDAAVPVSHISKRGVIHATDTFIYGTITSFFFICISGVVAELRIGDASQAGTITTFNTIGSFLVGFAFAKIFETLKRFTAPVLYIVMSLGVFLVLNSTSLTFACAAAFIYGIGYGAYFSYFLAKVSMISDENSLDANMSLCNGIYYLSMFAASFAVSGVASVFQDDSTVFSFKFLLGSLIVLTAVHFILAIVGSNAGGRKPAPNSSNV